MFCLVRTNAPVSGSIAELKHDLGADGFCLKKFFATEAAFRAVLLLFNLLAEFQRAAGLPGYREPATIRTQVLTCGAILGRAGRCLVCPPVGKLGRPENKELFVGQRLELANPNFAEVGFGAAGLSLLNFHGKPRPCGMEVNQRSTSEFRVIRNTGGYA